MSRLVENTNDPRFRNVQKRLDKVLSGFFRRGHVANLQIGEVSKNAHIYNSTFYDHYPHMDAAFYQLERRAEPELQKLKLEAENLSLENIYRKILHFIIKEQEYYGAMLIRKNATPLLQIPETFQTILCKEWRNYNKDLKERIFQLFAWEFCGVIYCWGIREKFNQSKLDYYARKLAKLTKTACDRLA